MTSSARTPSHFPRHILPLALVLVLVLLPVVSAFSELKGAHLKGCVLIENPYVVDDSTRRTGFSGIAITYLERLIDNLQFTIELEQWNLSFSAFIEEMAVCSHRPGASRPCPCHIGVGSFTMTNARAEIINFIWAFGNEAHAMVSRASDLRVDDSQNVWFVFKTFSPTVWIIIFVGVFLHAIGTFFFAPFCEAPGQVLRNAQNNVRSAAISRSCTSVFWIIKRFPAAIVFAYAHLVGHPIGEGRRGTPSFHRAAWLVLGVTAGLFLLTVYEASLTVLLFESTKESPFKTLSDITDCNLDPSRVAIINGGASQKFWNTAVNTTENQQRCGWGRVGLTVDDLEQGFQFVKEEKADYFYSLQGSVTFRANRNCEQFEQVGEPFFSTSVGFVMAKDANQTLLSALSRETRILREQDAFESASLLAARNACEDVVDATVTSGKLAAFFTMYGVVWTVLLMYRIGFLWKHRDNPAKNEITAPPENVVVMDMQSMQGRNITGMAGFSDRHYEAYYDDPPPT